MIYRIFNEEVLNEEERSYIDRLPIMIINGKRYGGKPTPDDFPSLEKNLYDKDNSDVALIQIPRQYARENEHFNSYEVNINDIECYRLYLFKQGNKYADVDAHNTYVILELPSGRKVNIIMYKNGGIEFEPMHRKYVLREYDALDRRIILGFCLSYQNAIKNVSNNEKDINNNDITDSIRSRASLFKENELNKRLKIGEVKKEHGIFSEVVLV